MSRPLSNVGVRPTCTEHPGSKIYVDRRSRRWSARHETVEFRCVPVGGQGRHLVSRLERPRQMAGSHPRANRACPHCGEGHEHGGPTAAFGFTFSLIEAAQAMVRVGRGDTYVQIAADVRDKAFRPRQPGRPRSRGRVMASRGPRSRNRSKASKDYDYTTPKPPTPPGSRPSRTASLVTGWIDAFAQTLIDAYAYQAWPAVIALDTLPIKRRRYAIRAGTESVVKRTSAGERNGEIHVAADCTTSPATPCLIALEGSKDTVSWIRFLRRLRTEVPPVWVVADIDDAIKNAVEEVWPSAIIYRCEVHLRRRIRAALADDGFDRWSIPEGLLVMPGDDDQALPDPETATESGKRRNNIDFDEHPLYALANRCQWSPAHWQEFVDAVATWIPADRLKTREWIASNTKLILDQYALREANPGMPRSAGAVETTIGRIGRAIGPRSEFFRNAGRLNRTLGLMRLEAAGCADETSYADIIGRGLADRPSVPRAKTNRPRPVGIDWVTPRDRFGTCSIDQMIDESLVVNAVAIFERNTDRRATNSALRGQEVDAWLASVGLPASKVGGTKANGTSETYRSVRGLTIADLPDLMEQYDPALNGGVPADQIRASWTRSITWRCRAHESAGHDHIWSTGLKERATHVARRCPKCAGRQACPSTSLRATRPDLAAQWVAGDKPGVTPDTVTRGSSAKATWKCAVDDHPPFRQHVYSRALQHAECPLCANLKRTLMGRDRDLAASRAVRRRAIETRTPKRPPVVPVIAPTEPNRLYSLAEAAAILGRRPTTVRGWVGRGRIIVQRVGPGKGAFMVEAAEIERLRPLLASIDPADAEA